MTTQEFSIQFDILYNNLASNAAPPLNEYEKSVFLTKAQSEIVLELYSGRNQLGLSFESNEEARKYLSNLNTSDTQTVENATSFYCPPSILFRTRMELNTGDKIIPIILISQDDKIKLVENPFKNGSSNRRILAIEDNNEIIICSPTTISGDVVIYGIRKPNPIIVPGIDDSSLTIEESSVTVEGSECELDSYLHYMILERAVLLAKQAYIGGQTQS